MMRLGFLLIFPALYNAVDATVVKVDNPVLMELLALSSHPTSCKLCKSLEVLRVLRLLPLWIPQPGYTDWDGKGLRLSAMRGLHGHHSIAAPEDDFGIVGLTNVDNEADPIENIVFGIAEDSVRRYIRLRDAGHGVTTRAAGAAPSYPDSNTVDGIRAVNKSLSPNWPDLFTYWGAVWYKHGYFAYTNCSNYNISIETVYPEGYGKNPTPFSALYPYATARFVVENGKVVGFQVGFNDSEVSTLASGGTVEETSQVWFVKKE